MAIVGARAATGYGQHVAIELAALLAERGVGVVSGGAYATKTQRRAPLPLARPTLKPMTGRPYRVGRGNRLRHV